MRTLHQNKWSRLPVRQTRLLYLVSFEGARSDWFWKVLCIIFAWSSIFRNKWYILQVCAFEKNQFWFCFATLDELDISSVHIQWAFSLNDFRWIHWIQWIMTKSKSKMVTRNSSYLEVDTFSGVVAKKIHHYLWVGI